MVEGICGMVLWFSFGWLGVKVYFWGGDCSVLRWLILVYGLLMWISNFWCCLMFVSGGDFMLGFLL